ncbi:MAG: GHMP kinase [Halobacteriovoraceae bacterium]|nr:GHMP kinase [Halobacteriovoraceae bacterium]
MEKQRSVDAAGKLRNFLFRDDQSGVDFDIPQKDKLVGTQRYFYGHGKLLLTGEYLVMDGAKGLALPTILGQSMSVKCKKTFGSAKVVWRSLDYKGKAWFSAEFEPWHFEIVKGEINSTTKLLQQILIQARKQNPHFLREDKQVVNVETRLEFPLEWGLGSSSTLLYNIAQWAYISPFELASKTFGGSGYDIACAQSMTPIVYQLESEKKTADRKPSWKIINFKPPFLGSLYFVYLGEKKKTIDEINYYKSLSKDSEQLKKAVADISAITDRMCEVQELSEFENLITEHELILSQILKYPIVKERLFKDYWGAVKSQGAWGGDFVLVTSSKSEAVTKKYFEDRGYQTIVAYKDIVCDQFYNNLSPKIEIQ